MAYQSRPARSAASGARPASTSAARPSRRSSSELLGHRDRRSDRRSTVFTFACTTGVLAHCTEWGYRPWAEAELCKNGKKGKKGKKCETVQLTDYHQTCTRMARADYCGDGVSWTADGTALDIWDDLSPQIQGRFLDWTTEAEWTPDGATA
ncbi:MAG: hypothetical protein H6710_21550 [Myxococcales bacterium]|nr:hypothetical protein [Myxococcales bacterium]